MFEIINLDGLVNFTDLCTVCLTSGPFMKKLDDDTDTKYGQQTIHTIFEEVSLRTCLQKGFPDKICSMCLRILVMSYELKKQYEHSMRRVQKALDVTFISDSSDVQKQLNCVKQKNNNVDLLVNGQKYSLNEVLIVEDDEERSDFTGFLKNLGTEVSARFVNKSQKTTRRAPGIIINDVSISIKQPQSKLQEDENFTFLDEFIVPNSEPIVISNVQTVAKKRMKRGERCYQCEFCGKEFQTRKAAYYNHKRFKHLIHLKPLKCATCGKTYKTRSGLYHHKAMHNGRPHKCAECNKTFYTPYLLKLHRNTHENIRNYLCNICGKTFTHGTGLTYHMKLHTGERNYLCKFCGSSFRISCALQRHLRTHTGAKPYECKFCARKFASSSEVKTHEMSHTGYRPHRCKYCDKGFTKTYNLKVHLMNHDGPHGCDYCSKTFIEVNILKMHMKVKHGVCEDDPDKSN